MFPSMNLRDLKGEGVPLPKRKMFFEFTEEIS